MTVQVLLCTWLTTGQLASRYRAVIIATSVHAYYRNKKKLKKTETAAGTSFSIFLHEIALCSVQNKYMYIYL